jgi:hypothetical protein
MKKKKKTYQRTYQRGNLALMRRIHTQREKDEEVRALHCFALPFSAFSYAHFKCTIICVVLRLCLLVYLSAVQMCV